MTQIRIHYKAIAVSFFVSLIIIIFGHESIEKSLHVYSPFPVSSLKFISMLIAYQLISSISLSLILIPIFKIVRRPDKATKLDLIKKNRFIIFALLWSVLLKSLLYIAQFTGIGVLFELSMNLNLHMDWYFGSTPNHVYHFFAFEVIFLIFYSIYLIIRKIRA